MAVFLEQLLQQINACKVEDALLKPYADTLSTHATQIYQKIQNKSILLLNPQSSYQFLAGFLAGIAKNCRIFLVNSQWKQQQWEQVLQFVKPHGIIWESGLEILSDATPSDEKRETEDNLIMIPTGGSSGNLCFVKHNWETLTASVTGFCRYFEQDTVNCFCMLPLYHVSGLMQFMRTFLTGGHLILYPYKTLETAWRNQDLETIHYLERLSVQHYFLSLVPTQLQRLLNYGAGEWLSQFKTVLLGGAPPWESLLDTARQYNIPIALTYGMTETASQVVTLKPKDFLAGNNSAGKVLPHAKISITGEEGKKLSTGEVGEVTIASESLGLGYYPDSHWTGEEFITDDLGYFDQGGYLHIVGRNSRKIISGGENVFPDEVEATILSTGLVTDVYVMGVADENWGEVVSAVYVPKNKSVTICDIEKELKQHLSHYKIPKQWIAVASIPRNEQGKVNKNAIALMINCNLPNFITSRSSK